MKAFVAIFMLFVLGACADLQDILRTKPAKTLEFTGSHLSMADCLQIELPAGNKLKTSLDRSRLDLYDSKKGWSEQHHVNYYAVSVYKEGKVELHKIPEEGELSEYAIQQLWTPVERCRDRLARQQNTTG